MQEVSSPARFRKSPSSTCRKCLKIYGVSLMKQQLMRRALKLMARMMLTVFRAIRRRTHRLLSTPTCKEVRSARNKAY